ncbi:MAG TPA: nuclear transport factor 2 family protein [Candidatus Acidoferrum sp.]
MIRSLTAIRQCLLFALLAFMLFSRCNAQEMHHADPAATEITAVLTSQQSAWNKGDIRTFMDGYWNSPEVTFSGSSGVSRGWQSVFTRYQQRYPTQAAMGHLDFSDLEIRSLSSTSAMVLGRWHLTLGAGDVGGVFTLVFQKFPEGWKIIHDHTSLVSPKQP